MATIVILSIIIALAIPVYKNVMDKQKQKSYENVIKMIALKAEQWAEETNLNYNTTITLKKLVAEGYYQADEGTGNDAKDAYGNVIDIGDVLSPIDNESMLCYTIDIIIQNGKPEATVNDSDKKDCDLAEQELDDAKVMVAAYPFKDGKVVGNKLQVTNGVLDWTKDEVLLVADSVDEKNYTAVEWSYSGTTETKDVTKNNIMDPNNIPTEEIDEKAYANIKVVDTALFLKEVYTVGLKTPKKTNRKNVTVRIDKESPTITIINDKDFISNSSNSRTITIKGSDSGSGLAGFYVSDTVKYNEGDFISTSYKTTIGKGNGIYYVYAVDNVGNISKEPTTFEISNIEEYPTCKIEILSSLSPVNQWYTTNVTVKVSTSVAGGTGIHYTIDANINNYPVTGYLSVGESKQQVIQLNENGIYNISCNVTNGFEDSDSRNVSIKIDKDPPTITSTNPLRIGGRDYDYKDNVRVNYDISGPASYNSLVCSPARNNESINYVNCVATKMNGKSASTSFEVIHKYEATYVLETCTEKYNCHSAQSCKTTGHVWCYSTSGKCDTCNGTASLCPVKSCTTYQKCDTRDVDCSYYTCPLGGVLNEKICEYQ